MREITGFVGRVKRGCKRNGEEDMVGSMVGSKLRNLVLWKVKMWIVEWGKENDRVVVGKG